MGNFSTPFIERTKEYVAGFIGEHFTEKICYHNIDHTLEVVEASEIIGKKCGVNDKDLEIVIVAAWFHDTGYYLGCQDHEKASADIARAYLKDQNVDKENIEKIVSCILSTVIPQQPNTLLEKILCDADLYHLSTESFFEKSELLLHEISFQSHKISPEVWLIESKDFVMAHKYHTSYGKKFLTPRLKKNLCMIQNKIKESSN